MNIAYSIIDSIENEYELSRGTLIARPNMGRTAEARAIAYYLIRECTFLTYEEIGRLFERTHSNILYGVKRIDRTTDSGIRDVVNKYLQIFNI